MAPSDGDELIRWAAVLIVCAVLLAAALGWWILW
jgi:hypothetical protein